MFLAPGDWLTGKKSVPKTWATKLDDWTSLDLGAAYAPGHAHVSALIGGSVVIPLSEVYAWAAGSNGQRGL